MAEKNCDMFIFIAWGIVGGALCIFGFCGNILSFLAFQKDKRSSTTTLLQSLAVSDFLLLASVFITDSVPYICDYVQDCVNPWMSWPYIRYIWILTPIAHMCSIWLVVLIALNRYWAVCHAVEMAHVWNNTRTPIYISIVVGFIIAFNLPRFFEYQMVTIDYTSVDENNNTITREIVVENRTDFGHMQSYKVVYKVLLVSLILILIPLVLLIAFTITILVVLQNTRQRVKQRTMKTGVNGTAKSARQKTPKSPKSKASQEITFILILVVVVAIICQAPLAVFHFIRYTSNPGCGHIVFYLDNISKLLVNVNSSINFIIYCLFSPKFRKLLISSLKCACCKDQIGASLAEFTTNWGFRQTGKTTAQCLTTDREGNEPLAEITPKSSSNDIHINRGGRGGRGNSCGAAFQNKCALETNGVTQLSNHQNGRRRFSGRGGDCDGDHSNDEFDDVIIANVCARDEDNNDVMINTETGESTLNSSGVKPELKTHGISTGSINDSSVNGTKSVPPSMTTNSAETFKTNENSCYQISENLNNALLNLQSLALEETKPCLSLANTDAQLQCERHNTDSNSSLIPSSSVRNKLNVDMETLPPYCPSHNETSQSETSSQKSNLKDGAKMSSVLNSGDNSNTATPAYSNDYGEEEHFDTPETPMLPKDFHSLLIPMRETVC